MNKEIFTTNGDCKNCNIHRVIDYIKNNRFLFDPDSKCGWCIARFGLYCLLATYEYYGPKIKNLDDQKEQMEKDFEEYREYHNYNE